MLGHYRTSTTFLKPSEGIESIDWSRSNLSERDTLPHSLTVIQSITGRIKFHNQRSTARHEEHFKDGSFYSLSPPGFAADYKLHTSGGAPVVTWVNDLNWNLRCGVHHNSSCTPHLKFQLRYFHFLKWHFTLILTMTVLYVFLFF